MSCPYVARTINLSSAGGWGQIAVSSYSCANALVRVGRAKPQLSENAISLGRSRTRAKAQEYAKYVPQLNVRF